MNKRIPLLVLFVALATAATTPVKADYDTYKAKMNQEEIRKDKLKIASAEQRQEYWKEWVEFSRKQYDKTLKKFGAESELTEDAKEQHAKAVKALEDSRQDKVSAQKDLNTDRKDLNQARP